MSTELSTGSAGAVHAVGECEERATVKGLSGTCRSGYRCAWCRGKLRQPAMVPGDRVPRGDTAMTNHLVDAAADAFSSALVQWRAQRRLTKKQLAAEMGFDPSYVSHVEARRHRPTEDFARRAETALQAGGLIWQRFREYEDARQAPAAVPRPRTEVGGDRRSALTGL